MDSDRIKKGLRCLAIEVHEDIYRDAAELERERDEARSELREVLQAWADGEETAVAVAMNRAVLFLLKTQGASDDDLGAFGGTDTEPTHCGVPMDREVDPEFGLVHTCVVCGHEITTEVNDG